MSQISRPEKAGSEQLQKLKERHAQSIFSQREDKKACHIQKAPKTNINLLAKLGAKHFLKNAKHKWVLTLRAAFFWHSKFPAFWFVLFSRPTFFSPKFSFVFLNIEHQQKPRNPKLYGGTKSTASGHTWKNKSCVFFTQMHGLDLTVALSASRIPDRKAFLPSRQGIQDYYSDEPKLLGSTFLFHSTPEFCRVIIFTLCAVPPPPPKNLTSLKGSTSSFVSGNKMSWASPLDTAPGTVSQCPSFSPIKVSWTHTSLSSSETNRT